MRMTILKLIVFAIFLAMLVIMNMAVFRSSYPMYWIVSAIGSVIILLFLPYKRFFNKRKF